MSLLAFISTGMLIFIALAVLLGLYNFVIAPMLARKSYARIARELGLSYDPEAKLQGLHGCEELRALRVKRHRRNLLHGTVDGVETVLVEIGPPGSEVDAAEMVYDGLICFRQPGRKLPPFLLFKHGGRGEGALKQHGEGLTEGFSIIELRDNPGFADFFLLVALRQEDEADLRALFTREVQDYFMERRDSISNVQGAGEWVGVVTIFWFDLSPRRAVKEFREEMVRVRRVHEVFARAAG